MQFSLFLVFLGDFDSSGAPVVGLWYGHLDMTCRTELFPPQPLLYTLQRDRKRVSHHFPFLCESGIYRTQMETSKFYFIVKDALSRTEKYFVWFCYFNLNKILLPPLAALRYFEVKNSLSSFVFLLVSLFVFSVCVLPLCGRCVCTAGLWCRRLLDSSRYDRSDTQCRHHSATQRLELTVVLWLR